MDWISLNCLSFRYSINVGLIPTIIHGNKFNYRCNVTNWLASENYVNPPDITLRAHLFGCAPNRPYIMYSMFIHLDTNSNHWPQLYLDFTVYYISVHHNQPLYVALQTYKEMVVNYGFKCNIRCVQSDSPNILTPWMIPMKIIVEKY